MPYPILNKVKISEGALEYEDFHGSQGVIVKIEQDPEDPLPSYDVRLDSGEILESLFPSDLNEVV